MRNAHGLVLRCALVATMTATAFVPIGAGAGSAGATAPKALIDASTVSGGASSQEAQAATAQGFAVTVVSDATWAAMTPNDFGQYDLLIAGDPRCGSLPPGLVSSAPVYGSVVLGHAGGRTLAGNRIVIGTDPVFHDGGSYTSTRATIIRDGIGFAGKQPGRTGMYFDDSCAGPFGQSAQTLAILNALSGGTGTWSIDSAPPCGGSVALIASNPAFSDLTTASLQGWGCSVHESFPTFRSDWSGLAVATDTASHPTCGVDPGTGKTACGEAYILIAGSGIVVTSGSISLTPATSTDPAGGSHTVTAHVSSGGAPLSGQIVNFSVTGQNAGAVGTCMPVDCASNASGDVTFTYSDSNGPGDDTIKGSFTDAAGSLQSATAQEHWVAAADPSITASPASVNASEGSSFTGPVATFTDPDPASTAGEYTASINWGDGTAASAGTISGPTGGPFTVTGTHTYAEEGTFSVKVTITDVDLSTNTATVTSTATVADAALTAGPAKTITATEGSSFSGPVGSFTDANTGAAAADFTASIDWGDGTTSPGTVSGPTGGPFTVTGTHTYADEGSYAMSVTVTDDGGSTATLGGTANVGDAALAAGTAKTITATEGSSFSGVVGSFTDANKTATAADFTASINWGDGTAVSAGTVSGPTGGPFTVSGTHTYADEGSYAISVTVTDDGGSTATLGGTANVGDAALSGGAAQTITSTEGGSFSGPVGSFTDANTGSTTADFTASINWGDGTPASTGTVTGPTGGPFTVSGTHSYADEGSYAIKVTVTDDGGSTVTLGGTANVGDAALTSSCSMPTLNAQSYTGPTATFSDGATTGSGSDFSASINWGDGSSSTGTITGGPGTAPYTVSGSHTYTNTGPFTVTTTVKDDGGATTTATCSVLIFAFATAQGGFLIGDKEATVGNSVTWWGSQWAQLNPMSGPEPPPNQLKGFAGFSTLGAHTCGGTWTTDPGNSTPPPASVPQFMAVIVTSTITQNGSQLSGNIPEIVIVNNNPGYGPDPGHPGTGKIVAVLCGG